MNYHQTSFNRILCLRTRFCSFNNHDQFAASDKANQVLTKSDCKYCYVTQFSYTKPENRISRYGLLTLNKSDAKRYTKLHVIAQFWRAHIT